MKCGASDDVPTSASEWAIRLYAGALSVQERQTFVDWLNGNSDKLREVEEAQAILRVSAALRDSEIARAHLSESLRSIDAETR